MSLKLLVKRKIAIPRDGLMGHDGMGCDGSRMRVIFQCFLMFRFKVVLTLLLKTIFKFRFASSFFDLSKNALSFS